MKKKSMWIVSLVLGSMLSAGSAFAACPPETVSLLKEMLNWYAPGSVKYSAAKGALAVCGAAGDSEHHTPLRNSSCARSIFEQSLEACNVPSNTQSVHRRDSTGAGPMADQEIEESARFRREAGAVSTCISADRYYYYLTTVWAVLDDSGGTVTTVEKFQRYPICEALN